VTTWPVILLPKADRAELRNNLNKQLMSLKNTLEWTYNCGRKRTK